jgi:hypothetical protein
MESTGEAGIGVLVAVGLGVGVDVDVGSADGLAVAGTAVGSFVFSTVLETTMGGVGTIVGVSFSVATNVTPSWHAVSPQIKISNKGIMNLRI